MKLEKQVVSLKLSKRLKELGVRAKCLFFYNAANNLQFVADNDGMEIIHSEYTSAFTVAELGEMLPPSVVVDGKTVCIRHCKQSASKQYGLYGVNLESTLIPIEMLVAPTEANARAKMLIYLLENKLCEQRYEPPKNN